MTGRSFVARLASLASAPLLPESRVTCTLNTKSVNAASAFVGLTVPSIC